VALVEAERLVGVCGDEEIYRGILRQAHLAEARPDGTTPDPEGAARRAPADDVADTRAGQEAG
jgi:hypothetical protein